MAEQSRADIDALIGASRETAEKLTRYARERAGEVDLSEVGRVTYLGEGVARVDGLPGVASQ